METGLNHLGSMRCPPGAWVRRHAAFRASLFNDPRVGLLDQTLGPGQSGASRSRSRHPFRLLIIMERVLCVARQDL